MKPTSLPAVLLLLLLPGVAAARQEDGQAAANVNSRYPVEHVTITGIKESAISSSLRADIHKLVGQNYDQSAVNDLAYRLQDELHGYSIDVKVGRGHEPEHLEVTFEVRQHPNRRFDVRVPQVVYNSEAGWSGALDFGFDTHHNYVSFGLVSSVEETLERNIGYRLRYEHRRVGTEKVQIRLEYEDYHQSFWSATQLALEEAPGVPGTYRKRENFAPSVSVLPVRAVKLTFGASFQNLEFDVPSAHTERAYAFIADAQLRHEVRSAGGWRQSFGAEYSLHKATTALESDLVYARHAVSGDYTLSIGRHLFGAHFKGGYIDGEAPLFERFMLGSATVLRGWNRFDVAPIGGSRLAYGSLEYRYRPFQIFYDFGSVWDPPHPAAIRHSIGAGLVWKHGTFISVAFPVRLEDVSPAFMFGVRF